MEVWCIAEVKYDSVGDFGSKSRVEVALAGMGPLASLLIENVASFLCGIGGGINCKLLEHEAGYVSIAGKSTYDATTLPLPWKKGFLSCAIPSHRPCM